MADSLFNDQEDTITIDESKKYFEELVGEGKKFKDPEALAKGKYYSDSYIEMQNRKMDQMRKDYLELRADYDARAKLEELLGQLEQRPAKPQSSSEEPKAKPEIQVPAINPDDIETIVSKKLAESKSADKAQENFNTVVSKLKERYGANYQNFLKEKTEELGFTPVEVDAMARRSPELFFRAMNMTDQRQETFQTPPRTDARFTPQGKQKKTWSYYQKLYKDNPKLYYDGKTTSEMVNSMAELGDEFRDGDFAIFGD